jgi:hypothetical protein
MAFLGNCQKNCLGLFFISLCQGSLLLSSLSPNVSPFSLSSFGLCSPEITADLTRSSSATCKKFPPLSSFTTRCRRRQEIIIWPYFLYTRGIGKKNLLCCRKGVEIREPGSLRNNKLYTPLKNSLRVTSLRAETFGIDLLLLGRD